jgi:hypothetical protein
MAEKSNSPAIPSLNVARRRYPPTHFIFATLIIIQTRDPGERRTGARPEPMKRVTGTLDASQIASAC